jgi:hypothetical protein
MQVVATGALATSCGHVAAPPAHATPDALLRAFAVLRAPQTEADPLPPVTMGRDPGGVGSWLPAGSIDPGAVRRLGSTTGGLSRPVYLVPTDDLRSRPPGCGSSASRGAGVCLVAGAAGQPLEYACAPVADALAGRAVVAAERTGTGARLSVLVPDGVRAVTVTQDGRSWDVAVTGNLAQRYLPLRGSRIGLTLRRDAPGCGTRVDPRLTRAVAALRARPGGAPPASLVGALEGGRIAPEAARIAGGGDGVTWWIVPAAFPSDGRCAPLRRACVIPVTDKPAGAPACATAPGARLGGAVIAGPLDGQVAVYGVVAPRVRAVRVTIDGRSGTARALHGVVGGVFPLPWHNGNGVRFTYLAAPRAPVVAVFDASASGRASLRARRRVVAAAFRSGLILGVRLPRRARTAILYPPGAGPLARSVRNALHAGAIAPLDARTRTLLGSRAADVVVLAGDDLARSR